MIRRKHSRFVTAGEIELCISVCYLLKWWAHRKTILELFESEKCFPTVRKLNTTCRGWVRHLSSCDWSWESRNGAVVRALASHQGGLGSISGLVVVCRLSLLLVLVLVPRGFSPGSPVFPSRHKLAFPIPNSIWIIVKHFIMSLWLRRLRKHSPYFWHQINYIKWYDENKKLNGIQTHDLCARY